MYSPDHFRAEHRHTPRAFMQRRSFATIDMDDGVVAALFACAAHVDRETAALIQRIGAQP